MSSSRDAGHYANQLHEALQTKCPKSRDGKHKPVVDYGREPSAHYKCKLCNKDLGYSK